MLNKDELFVSTVIVAAGMGKRMNMEKNKQFIEIEGTPVLARTLERFENTKEVKEVVLVVNEKEIPYCKQNILDKYKFKKVKAIIAGGKERQNSVYNGLNNISKETDIVLIHDGARPFVKEESIQDSIIAANEYGVATVAVPVVDTIKTSTENGFVGETLNRKILWSIQTPQGFRYDLILKAHKEAIEKNYIGTDDTVLVEKIGVNTKLVMGSYDNIKITTKDDLLLAKGIISN